MIKKYMWKCRVLLIKTPDYKNLKYKAAKKLYQKDIKHFHKRVIKLVTIKIGKGFMIELYGFDGAKKQTFKNFNSKLGSFNPASSKQINDSFFEIEEMLLRVGYLLKNT